MAHYGDGKHNENMEYVAPKMKIVGRNVYKTIEWIIETDVDMYKVQCQGGEFEETWLIEGQTTGDVYEHSELGQQIIDLCCDYEVFDVE